MDQKPNVALSVAQTGGLIKRSCEMLQPKNMFAGPGFHFMAQLAGSLSELGAYALVLS